MIWFFFFLLLRNSGYFKQIRRVGKSCGILTLKFCFSFCIRSKTNEKKNKGNGWRRTKKFSILPIPGVEPGPPGWKPGILTARPYGNYIVHQAKSIVIKLFVTVILTVLLLETRFRWVTIFSEEQFYLNHKFSQIYWNRNEA